MEKTLTMQPTISIIQLPTKVGCQSLVLATPITSVILNQIWCRFTETCLQIERIDNISNLICLQMTYVENHNFDDEKRWAFDDSTDQIGLKSVVQRPNWYGNDKMNLSRILSKHMIFPSNKLRKKWIRGITKFLFGIFLLPENQKCLCCENTEQMRQKDADDFKKCWFVSRKQQNVLWWFQGLSLWCIVSSEIDRWLVRC